ncbi:MAG: hypothetical protein ACREH3_04935 [Geminicoccales bacterium]
MRTRLLASLAMLALLGGCATRPPLEEARLFARAYNAVDAASQPLLDDLALAERRSGIAQYVDDEDAEGRVTRVGTRVFVDEFSNRLAPYYSALFDPPGTAVFRDALKLVGQYTEVLLTLAEGRNLETARAQLQMLSSNVASVAALVPGAQSLAPVVGPALAALQPVIDAAAQAQNRAEMERLVVQAAPELHKLIGALQDAARPIFLVLIADRRDAITVEGLDNPQLAEAAIDRVDGYRVAVSNYAVLLGQLNHALDSLVSAFDSARSSVTLAALAEQSAELSVQADALRRTFAVLRSGAAVATP